MSQSKWLKKLLKSSQSQTKTLQCVYMCCDVSYFEADNDDMMKTLLQLFSQVQFSKLEEVISRG